MTAQAIESSTKLNPVQLHLMELFSRAMGERELLDIKELLVQYYSKRADDELDNIWEKRGYTQKSYRHATRSLHRRSSQKRSLA